MLRPHLIPQIRPRTLALSMLALVAAFAVPTHANVIFTNATTSLTVNGGDVGNGPVNFGGYFDYLDFESGVQTTWSIDPILILPTGATIDLADGPAGGFGTPEDLGNGYARSTAFVDPGLTILAETGLFGTVAQTNFTFITNGSLNGYYLVFYAENDIPAFNQNAANFTGSIAGGDLAVFQAASSSGGVVVQLDGSAGTNAQLTSFGSGDFTGFGNALSLADLSVLSADGSNFVFGPGDLGIALGFELSGSGGATLTTNYSVFNVVVPEVNPIIFLACAMGIFVAYRVVKMRRIQQS